MISDEVFSEFIYDKKFSTLPRPSAVDSDVTVFTLNGISKMFASPDLKLSWIGVSGNKNRVNRVMNALEISNDVFLNCNSISQFILPKLFEQGKDFQNDMLCKLKDNRNIFIDKLKHNKHIEFIRPKGGIHSVVKVKKHPQFTDDEEFAIQLLRRNKIYVHPGYFYGIEDDNEIYVIMSFLKETDTLITGLDHFNSFFTNI